MDDIVNIIYSEKNLTNLSKKFSSFFDEIDTSDNAQNACKTWLKKKMSNVVDINRNLRGEKREIVKKLNSDCLKMAVNEYRSHQNNKTTGQNLNKYKMEREKDIYGNRKNRVEKRPQYRDESRGNSGNGKLGSIADTGGFASFSSNSDGEVIRADGTIGDKMFFGNLNDVMQTGDKKTIAAELERRMMMRKGEYEGFDGGQGPDMNGMGMGNSMGNGMGNSMDMNNFGNPGMYNPNFGVPANKRPPEINFRLDGTDSRDKPSNNLDQMNMEHFNGFTGFGNMGMDNFGSFNQMGMNQMGNQMGMNQMGNQMGMNQMGNQMGMNQMGMNQMGNQIDMRMNQMQNERGYAQRNNNNRNQNQMGMNNMNMNNMNMNNMNMYQSQQDMQQHDDLANKVNQMRNHIASNIGLDPQALLYMTPEEIEGQIRRQANKKESVMEYDRKPNRKYVKQETESEEEESEDESDKKTKLLKMLIDMKKNNQNKEKGLKKAVNDVKKKNSKKNNKYKSESESESESSKSESEEEKPKQKKNVKFAKQVVSSDSEDDNKSTKSTKSIKSTKQNQQKIKVQDKKKSQKDRETITIDIIQDDELNNKYYSDFMIDFNEKYGRTYKNITNFKLKIKTLPDLKPYIDETCNKLKIIIGNETKKIELDDGYYELDELLEGITENLEDVNIICKKDKKGRVIFESTNKEEFEIDCEDCSFGKYLGFTEEKYETEYKYIAESTSPLAIDKIYLYFPNISENYFCTINNDKKINMNYEQENPIAELDCLIIQIKDIEINEELNFHNFSGNKIEFTLTFDCDEE